MAMSCSGFLPFNLGKTSVQHKQGYWRADLDITIDYPLFLDSNSLSDVSMIVVFYGYLRLFMGLLTFKVITAIIYIITNALYYSSV